MLFINMCFHPSCEIMRWFLKGTFSEILLVLAPNFKPTVKIRSHKHLGYDSVVTI